MCPPEEENLYHITKTFIFVLVYYFLLQPMNQTKLKVQQVTKRRNFLLSRLSEQKYSLFIRLFISFWVGNEQSTCILSTYCLSRSVCDFLHYNKWKVLLTVGTHCCEIQYPIKVCQNLKTKKLVISWFVYKQLDHHSLKNIVFKYIHNNHFWARSYWLVLQYHALFWLWRSKLKPHCLCLFEC